MIKKGVTNVNKALTFSGVPSAEDFELIKQLMPSDDISKEDIFVYKVLLCDNMIDRDFERFTHRSLEKLAELFVGRIGIEDHDPTVKNAHSRIYDTELVIDDNITNDIGEKYEYVLGKAYIINNDKNRHMIDDIKSGLKKEVSVGVSNTSLVCSICGEQIGDCKHRIGSIYDEIRCVGLMDGIDDVYEWSFVSIPSQRKAGVIKSKTLKEEVKDMNLREVVQHVIKSANVSDEHAKELMDAVEKAYTPNDEVVKSLEVKVADLEKKLTKALEEVEEYKESRTEDALERLIDELEPYNDKIKGLIKTAISDLVTVDEKGNLTDESIEAIKAELTSEEYKPMFKGCNKEVEDETLEKEVEEPVVEEKSFVNKNIDFKHSNKVEKSSNIKVEQKTGVMGIHFRVKE